MTKDGTTVKNMSTSVKCFKQYMWLPLNGRDPKYGL